MTELGQLLLDDAGRDRLDPPQVPSLDDAVERARVSTRRRHALTTGLALTAAGVVSGGVLYATAAPTSQHPRDTRLAAYDQILGPDVSQPSHVWVVGPADEHTAYCTRVPGAHVDVHRDDEGRVTSMLVTRPVSHVDESSSTQELARVPKYLPPGPYFLFRCPMP